MAIEERIVFPAVLNALRQKTGQISLCKWPTATARFLSRTLKRNSAHSGETSLRWKRKRRRSGLTEQLGSSCRRDWAPRARNLHGPAVLVRRERLQVGRGAKDVEHATSQRIDTSTSMANEPFAMCREPTRWVKLRPSGPIRDEVHTAGRPIRLRLSPITPTAAAGSAGAKLPCGVMRCQEWRRRFLSLHFLFKDLTHY